MKIILKKKKKSSLIGITYKINNTNKFKIDKSKNVNITISFSKKLITDVSAFD